MPASFVAAAVSRHDPAYGLPQSHLPAARLLSRQLDVLGAPPARSVTYLTTLAESLSGENAAAVRGPLAGPPQVPSPGPGSILDVRA